MSFKEGLGKIADGVKDIAELNVRTFTGSISSITEDQKPSEMLAGLFTSGDIKVVGLSIMKIDGDIDQFFSDGEEATAELKDLHMKAVDAGAKSRATAFNLFSSAITKAINKLED